MDVTFAGTTYTHKDVAEFMTRLGLIPQLTNIQLASSTGAPGRGPIATRDHDRGLHRDGLAARLPVAAADHHAADGEAAQ